MNLSVVELGGQEVNYNRSSAYIISTSSASLDKPNIFRPIHHCSLQQQSYQPTHHSECAALYLQCCSQLRSAAVWRNVQCLRAGLSKWQNITRLLLGGNSYARCLQSIHWQTPAATHEAVRYG